MCCTRLAVNTGRKKSPSLHHSTTLSGCIFASKAHIDNRKNWLDINISSTCSHNMANFGPITAKCWRVFKQQYLLKMSAQYGKLRPTSGWDRSGSLRHRCKFQRVSRLGTVTARYSSNGRQPNFAALNRGRHLYSAGLPSRLALAHSLVSKVLSFEHTDTQ